MTIARKMDEGNKQTEKLERKAKKDIAAEYQNGLDEIRKELAVIEMKYGTDGVVDYAEMQKHGRLTKLNKANKSIMNGVASAIAGTTVAFGADVWETNYYYTGYSLETELQEKIAYSKQKRAKVKGKVVTPDMQLSMDNNKDFEQQKIRNVVQRGLAQGKPIREISKDLKVQFEKSATNALTTARTTMTRVQNEAIVEAGEKAANKGIDLVKQWNATLDDRTRDRHRELDQVKIELDEDFEIDGFTAPAPGQFGDPAMDYNCRCVLTYVPRDVTEAEYRRARGASGKGKVIPYTNYKDWYDNRVVKSN